MKPKEVIGARTHIVFPGDNSQSVLAKVDTGADYSAVWASDIEEANGVLSFKLFAQGSRYYTGKIHTTSSFSIVKVKNSFGNFEVRYKVPLAITMGERRIRAEFNLADRSRNRYPVLIGKKTLSGKFIVDTSVTPSAAEGKVQRVLMLNSLESERVEQFARALQDATTHLRCDFSTYGDLILIIGQDGSRVVKNSTGDDLDPYDLVYFKTHSRKQEFAAALSIFFDSRATPYIDKEIKQHCSNSKITQYMRLWQQGLPIPKSVIINRDILQSQYDRFVEILGSPFILKDPQADKGLRNYLVKSEQQFMHINDQTPADQDYYIAQEFIKNDGDLRLIVLSQKVKMIIGRRPEAGSLTHLSNTSTGGVATNQPLDAYHASVKALAVRAAIALSRQVAGVDLMQSSETGLWYILEVNNAPQLASGAYTEEKIKMFGTFLRDYARK